MLLISFIMLLIGVLIFIYLMLPTPPTKVSGYDKYYAKDYDNLINCIEKAKSEYQLRQCCKAVYRFQKRNQHLADYNVSDDVNHLGHLIDLKFFNLNLKQKQNLN